MLYYFVPLLGALLHSLIRGKQSQKLNLQYEYLFVVFTCIFYCSGYMTGSDWKNYELLYANVSLQNFASYNKEFGFYFIMILFKAIGFEFFPFLMLMKAFVYCSYIKLFLKYTRNIYYILFLFFGLFALFIFIDNPLRFMIAVGIINYSYPYLEHKKFFNYLALVLLASTFHISSLIMILVYFFINDKFSGRLFLILFTIFYFAFTSDTLLFILKNLPKNLLFDTGLYFYIARAETSTFQLLTIGNIFYYILFLFVYINKCYIHSKHCDSRILYSGCILWFVFFKLGTTLPTLFRISYFVAPYFCISIDSIIKEMPIRKNKYIAIIFLSVYILFSNYKNIYYSWVYYPYTNYFIETAISSKSYNERILYNKEFYYSRFGKRPNDSFLSTDK